jgi:hypothetical protein
MSAKHYVPRVEAREAWQSWRRFAAIARAFKPGAEYAHHGAEFRKEFLEWIRTEELEPLERAAIYGLLQTVTGINREAERAAALWTKEFNDDGKDEARPSPSPELSNIFDADGREGLQKQKALSHKSLEDPSPGDGTPPGWRVL